MTTPSSQNKSKVRRIWKAAQLLVGFHRDPQGVRRAEPYAWAPKNGRASIHPDILEQEAFLVLKSANGDQDNDVQIKFHPNAIVLRRDYQDAWQGILVSDHAINVLINGIRLRINHDGSVTRETDGDTTWLEADGSVLKKTEYVEAMMSADGVQLSRRSEDGIAAITEDGILAKQRG